ncbi:imidazole glycerol phosphate synthase subunit HisH [Raineya orbicola]|jgi:glutamine amidotransferase|uniref:Imidazole glycerol phosphate synthase subunit HisH n=1 Tax=Raineya orbicola TaxID=2016530 RepID=A0A2N3IH50_9BACT|nr:imidazole glycerol phosphate synthase subunit HisH [Raineya orbicola]PKQ69634.1 Imidazole glycerol phosphate synthase, glutamine amidotransferase subunit [Raineya orbicola]
MNVAIVQYNAGNVQSVLFALKRLGVEGILTDKPEILQTADRVIFPGVGEASSAMNYLQNRGLDKVIRSLTQPVLGICLGLQLLCKHSEEGNTECLGIFDLKVKKFPTDRGSKVPHVGWNSIENLRSELFSNVVSGSYVYYVHSYYAEIGSATIAQTEYILPFSAALQHKNFYAVQFHPEKSSNIGEQILKNFLQKS